MTTARKVVSTHFNLLPYHRARYRGFLENHRENFELDVILMRPTQEYAQFRQDLHSPEQYAVHRAGVEAAASYREVARRIRLALERAGPDVIVLLGGYSSLEMLESLIWARQRGIPTVVCSESKADDADRLRWREWSKKLVLRSTDTALVGGIPHAAYMEDLGVDPENIFTGYDVVDNSYFREATSKIRSRKGRPEDVPTSPFFLAVNRFVERKNMLRLLRAYAAYVDAVGEAAWPLVLVGDGPQRAEVDRTVTRLGLTNVWLVGFVQIEELPKYYAYAGCFVHPAVQEQWGLVVNEAMASGLPVLVSQTAGCRYDLVAEGLNGFLFDPMSEHSIEAGLLRVHRLSEVDRAGLGARSVARISEWSPERFGRSLNAAIERAIAVQRNAPPISPQEKLALEAVKRFVTSQR